MTYFKVFGSFGITENKAPKIPYAVRWGKFSQKHNYEYMAKWWCLL